MELSQGDRLEIWNKYLFRLSQASKETTVDTLLSQLKEYLRWFPIQQAVINSAGLAFKGIPLPVFERRRRVQPTAHAPPRHRPPRVRRKLKTYPDASAQLRKSDQYVDASLLESFPASPSTVSDQDTLLGFSDGGLLTEAAGTEEVYSEMFNSDSGCINLVEDFVNALSCFTRFAVHEDFSVGVEFICDLMRNAKDDIYFDEAKGRCSIVGQWVNWQILITQGSKCIAYLLKSRSNTISRGHMKLVHSSAGFLFEIIRKNISDSRRFCEMLQFGDYLALDDECVQSTYATALSVIGDVLEIYEVYNNVDILSNLAELVVSWSQDSSFSLVLSKLMQIMEARIFSSKTSNSRIMRFAFQLFASLVNTSYATTYMMTWSLRCPRGFGGAVTSFELIEALTTQIASGSYSCVLVLERHLPMMKWIPCIADVIAMHPSDAITELVDAIRSAKSIEFLVNVCACVLNSNPLLEDARYIVLELATPVILSLSQQLQGSVKSFVNIRSLSILLEIVLPVISKDKDIAKGMIRNVLSPFRHVFMNNRDLEDSFVLFASKCISSAHVVAKESGLSGWLFTCIHICYKQAAKDIWSFMMDSASKCNRALFCALFIIHHALEQNLRAFAGFEGRITKQLWQLIELALTSLNLSPENLGAQRRVAELTAFSISVVLLLTRNPNTHLSRFSSAFIGILGNCPHPPVIYRVIVSVLVKILKLQMSPCTPGAVKTMRLIRGQDGVVCILEIVHVVLQLSSSLNTEHCFMIRKLCKILDAVQATPSIEQWIHLLFDISEIVIKKSVEELDTIDAMLRLLSRCVKCHPRPSYVSRIIGFLCTNDTPEVRVIIFRWFSNIVSDDVGATVSLVMPQSPAEFLLGSSQTNNPPTSLVQEECCDMANSSPSYCNSFSDVGIVSSSECTTRNAEKRQEGELVVVSQNPDLLTTIEPSHTTNLKYPRGAFSICDCSFPKEGLTVSFWIKRFLSIGGGNHDALHLGSVIGSMVRCSFLLTSTGRIVFELNNGTLIEKRKFKGKIRQFKWTHICISFVINQSSIIAEGMLGDRFSTLELPFIVSEGLLFENTVEYSFGSLSTQRSHRFLISPIFIFRGQLSRSSVLLLKGFGCRLSSLEKSFCEKRSPTLINVLNKRLIMGNSSAAESASSNSIAILEELQNALLFTWDPSQANIFTMYSVTSLSNLELSCSDCCNRYVADSQVCSVYWWCEKVMLRLPSVDDAIKCIGGVKILLFLYVKFVNDSMPATLQIAALDVLFSSLRRNCAFLEEANRMRLVNILVKTLSSQLAYFGNEILQLVINHCFMWEKSSNALTQTSISNHCLEFCPSEAVIRSPGTLVDMCSRYEIWYGERFCQWKSLIAVIAKSLHTNICPQASFNQFQLSRCNMLEKLFHCLLEMFHNSDAFPDPSDYEEMVSDVVAIVESLLPTPGNIETISLLWNFITISHPANATYLKHDVLGHYDWINLRIPPEDVYAILEEDTELCVQLRHYLDMLGSDFVSSMWCGGSSVFEIRREFEMKSGHFLKQTEFRHRSESLEQTSTSANSCERCHVGVVTDTHTTPSKTNWIAAVRTNMMTVMNGVLQNGSDSLLTSILHNMLSWEALLILLTDQKDLKLREAVVRMLQNFMLRSPKDTQISFLRMDGMRIFANQLVGCGVTHATADSLFSLMCGEPVILSDGLDVTLLTNMHVTRMSCESFHTILVALEESVSDAALFWNMTSALCKIFESNMQLQIAMFECHLVEHLVNVLRKIAYFDTACKVVANNEVMDTTVLLDAWSKFAQLILTSVVPYSDGARYKFCEKFIWLLKWTDWQSSKDDQFAENIKRRAHRVIREQFCQLLRSWIECIWNVLTIDDSSASVNQSTESVDSASSVETVEINRSAMKSQESTSFTSVLVESFASFKAVLPYGKQFLDCPYPKQSASFSVATIDTLHRRLIFVLEEVLNVFVVLHPSTQVPAEEEQLFIYYLNFMLSCLKSEKQGTQQYESAFVLSLPSSLSWIRLKIMSYHRIRSLLLQLTSFTVFPAQTKLVKGSVSHEQSGFRAKMRHLLIKSIFHKMSAAQHLRSLVTANLDCEASLNLGLCEMAVLSTIDEDLKSDIENLLRLIANRSGETVFLPFTYDSIKCLGTDNMLSLYAYAEHRKMFFDLLYDQIAKICENDKQHTVDLSKMSMQATSKVVASQSLPRKEFIRATRKALLEIFEAEIILKDIVNQLCHPEAPCFIPRCWPVGWALDPTEGPMRERRRLMPSYYAIDASFFQQDRQPAIKNNREIHPLANITSNAHAGGRAMQCAVTDEHILMNLDVKLLRGTAEYSGEILVGKTAMYFFEKSTELVESDFSLLTKNWKYEDVAEILPRQNMLNCTALEIFLYSGDACIIVFKNEKERENFKLQLSELGHQDMFPNVVELFRTSMRAWRHNVITNFEYIMILNTLSGRSFNDLMQYPVFPFILANYSSPVLDLHSEDSFRDLGKPMAIQDSKMEAHYINNYRSIEVECCHSNSDVFPVHLAPYHYGSHYSNVGIITYYLVRLYPYTEMAIKYQDNSFDIADRIFNSIEDAWRLSSSESTTDFKELTPEFFNLPEFLKNREKFELGTRQCGEAVGDVRLPDWVADADPRIFIFIHRQALESAIVTQNLHLWIDLVFGFKQTGKNAIDAINVFHPSTYAGTLDNVEVFDEVTRSALNTMVRSYGQMPMQLLHAPHQPHLSVFPRDNERYPAPVESVRGIRWGDYVGSPLQSDEHINVVFSIKTSPKKPLYRVSSLPDGSVVGVPSHSLLIFRISDQSRTTETLKFVEITAIGVVRVWRRTLQLRICVPTTTPWYNIADLDDFLIMSMAFSPKNYLIALGTDCGAIITFQIDFDAKGAISAREKLDLIGHSNSITTTEICDEFSVLVSADSSGKVIIWDSNKLTFVRVLRQSCSFAVRSVCISRTTGDIAVATDVKGGSIVEFYTINGDLVKKIDVDDRVLCMTISSQNEGTAVNCLALGLQSGDIRLIETWKLSTIRTIRHSEFPDPVISIEYSLSSRRLFASKALVNSDVDLESACTQILAWQYGVEQGRHPNVNFILLED